MSRPMVPWRRGWRTVAAGLAGLALSMGAWAQASADASPDEVTSYLRAEPVKAPLRGAAELGQGPLGLRFVVRDPEAPNRPLRRGPYQLLWPPGLGPSDGPRAHEGTTDAEGRTAVYRFEAAPPAAAWSVLPLIGQGPEITGSRIVSTLDEPIAGHAYLLDVDGGPMHCGRSLPSGHTVRLRHAPGPVRVGTDIELPLCQRMARALNPAMALADPVQRIAALRRGLADPGQAPLRPVWREKLRQTLLQHGSEAELRAWLAEALAAPGLSRASRAEILNDLGYGLVGRLTPRWPELALQWLTEAEALAPTPAILDSLGWAQHQAGRHDQALRTLDRARAAFVASCLESDEPAFQETQAHRAQVLHRLGQTEAALDTWAELLRQAPGERWVASLQDWPAVAEAAQAEARRREAHQQPRAPDCQGLREAALLQQPLSRTDDAAPVRGPVR